MLIRSILSYLIQEDSTSTLQLSNVCAQGRLSFPCTIRYAFVNRDGPCLSIGEAAREPSSSRQSTTCARTFYSRPANLSTPSSFGTSLTAQICLQRCQSASRWCVPSHLYFVPFKRNGGEKPPRDTPSLNRLQRDKPRLIRRSEVVPSRAWRMPPGPLTVIRRRTEGETGTVARQERHT